MNKKTTDSVFKKPLSPVEVALEPKKYKGVAVNASQIDKDFVVFDTVGAEPYMDEVTSQYGLKDTHTGLVVMGDKIHELSGTTMRLYLHILSLFTAQNTNAKQSNGKIDRTVRVSVKDYVNSCLDPELTDKDKIKERKKYIKQTMLKDVGVLFYLACARKNNRIYHLWDNMADPSTTIDEGYIEFVLNPSVAEEYIANHRQTFFMTDNALYLLPNKVQRIANYISINAGSYTRVKQGTNDTYSVKELLHLCQCEYRSLPTIEEVREKGKSAIERIVKPFFENYLDPCAKLFTWQFRTGRKDKDGNYTYLEREEALALPYDEFIKGYIEVSFLYATPTRKELVELAEQKEQERQEAQKRAIKAKYAKKDRQKA